MYLKTLKHTSIIIGVHEENIMDILAGVFNVDKGEDNIGWGNVVEPNTNTPFKTKSRGYDFKRNVRYFGIK